MDEHSFPAGIGVVEVHGSLKFVPCLPQGPRVSYIELDEPGFRLVRDVRRDALERHGIADGFGGGLCFFGRLGQAFAQGRDAEVGENPRRQRVGDDAAAGVQLGKEIGGKGKGGFRFFRKGSVPVQPCRDGPDAFGAALQDGYAAVIKDLADGWSYPTGNVGYDDHWLARVRPCPHGCGGHVGELGDLFVRHVGGHVLRDDKQIHGGLPREDAEAGGVGFLEVAASPCVQRVGERGIRRQHAAEPGLALFGKGRELKPVVGADVREHPHFAAGNGAHAYAPRGRGSPPQPRKEDGGFEQLVQRVDPDDVPAPEEGVERPVVPGDGSGMRCRHPAGQFRASHLERDDGLSRVTGPAARVRYAFGIADGFHEQGDDGGFGVIHKVIHVIGQPEGGFVSRGNEPGKPGFPGRVAEGQQHRAALGDDADAALAEGAGEGSAVHADSVRDVGVADAVGAAEEQTRFPAKITDFPLHGRSLFAGFGKPAGKGPYTLDAACVGRLQDGKDGLVPEQDGGAVHGAGDRLQ